MPTLRRVLIAFALMDVSVAGAGTGAGRLDVKIARGLGAHGYDAVRISVTEGKEAGAPAGGDRVVGGASGLPSPPNDADARMDPEILSISVTGDWNS